MYQSKRKIQDFEFYYLFELTRQKIKPLSRWEKPLPDQMYHWLRGHGLQVEMIPRKTLSGKAVTETIFSTSRSYTDLYQKKFSNTFISNNAESQELEGFLFGYPSCCVKQFIHYPYSPNDLDLEVQSLLFHWACDACRSTAGLIPYYQSIYQSVRKWHQQEFPNIKRIRNYRKSLQKIVAVLMLSGGFLSAQTTTDSTHYIPLPNDLDNNGLSYAEEIYLGTYDHGYPSENCQFYAKLFKALIDSLPASIQTDRTYRLEHITRGEVQCPKCGLIVNMGYVTVVNPLRDLQMDIPYLGLHFMDNGFFSYGSDKQFQRVDIDTLKKIIYPFDAQHLLPVDGDSDGDGLKNAEEDSLWIDYTADNPDFDANGIPDGVQIAEELIRLFPNLKEEPDSIHSSIEFKPVWGMENCQICGSLHNMGYIEIINPENKRTCQVPYISLHAMAHGSFTFNGTVHENQRTDVIELYRTMKTHMLFISDDTDNDGLKDEEEKYFGFDPNNADSNDDGVGDGMELAITLADMIKSLPTVPSLTEPYVEYLGMDGIHLCAICGREIPMGLFKIHNPLRNSPLPIEFTNYAFHFLQKGSFACEGAEQNRIDPIELSRFLDLISVIDSELPASLPAKFELSQNYPNPFNPETTIHYFVMEKMDITLKVYDIRGQEIKTLVNQMQSPGDKTVVWDGTANDNSIVSSGLYLYKLTAGGVSQSKKMLLLR